MSCLTVPKHVWIGGLKRSNNGINLPKEEVTRKLERSFHTRQTNHQTLVAVCVDEFLVIT